MVMGRAARTKRPFRVCEIGEECGLAGVQGLVCVCRGVGV